MNEGGYVLPNLNPCCSTCNYAKRKMPPSEFIALVKRVYRHSVEELGA